MRSNINRLARQLACFALVTATTLIALPARAAVVDLFNSLVTGNRNNFDGTVGFGFTANSNFTIADLGRAVNPNVPLTQSHTVELWDETTSTGLGSVTVGPASPIDALGYAFAPLATPINVVSGHSYALSSLEFNGGDVWSDFTGLGGKYNTSLITINRSAYDMAGGYPASGGAAEGGYVVPTFFSVVTPEPSSLVLAGLSAVGLLFAVRRRRVGKGLDTRG